MLRTLLTLGPRRLHGCAALRSRMTEIESYSSSSTEVSGCERASGTQHKTSPQASGQSCRGDLYNARIVQLEFQAFRRHVVRVTGYRRCPRRQSRQLGPVVTASGVGARKIESTLELPVPQTDKDQGAEQAGAPDPSAKPSEAVVRQQNRRKARLAAELRANLAKRKTLSRAKSAPDEAAGG